MRYLTRIEIGSPGRNRFPMMRTAPPVLTDAELTLTAGSGAG